LADRDFRELFNFFHSSGESTVGEGDNLPLGSKTEWLFGRSTDCDFIYALPKVSRQHFKISLIDSHYYLTDLGSTNGTYLNGKRISRMERLFAGDVISMGDTDIVFTKDILY